MIRYVRPAEPDLLKANKVAWTQAFVDACVRFGHWSAVPAAVADPLKHYKDPRIIECLLVGSHGKCSYCDRILMLEEAEVEHFLPKPHYPELSFEWENFLPVCGPCNAAKANVDVGLQPIVNPSRDNPEAVFGYSNGALVTRPSLDDALRQKANCSIEVLDLNRQDLLTARRAVLANVPLITTGQSEFLGLLRFVAAEQG